MKNETLKQSFAPGGAIYEYVQENNKLFTEAVAYIEHLESALREIATERKSDSEQAFNFKMIARKALEGKDE
jgi:hypothetical protein